MVHGLAHCLRLRVAVACDTCLHACDAMSSLSYCSTESLSATSFVCGCSSIGLDQSIHPYWMHRCTTAESDTDETRCRNRRTLAFPTLSGKRVAPSSWASCVAKLFTRRMILDALTPSRAKTSQGCGIWKINELKGDLAFRRNMQVMHLGSERSETAEPCVALFLCLSWLLRQY